jgi:hypothetical protein
MRKSSVLVSVGLSASVLVLTPVLATPAGAAPVGLSVGIVAHTSFESDVSAFEASLPGCESGTVVNGADIKVAFTPRGGSFVGTKEFTCAGGQSGFDLVLKARFGGGGSTGTWVVSDAWGDFAGMKGSGSLVGVPVSDTQIDDIYTGTVR